MRLKRGPFQAMNIVTTFKDWQRIRETLHKQSVGLVHTMGNLHQGHLSLCQRSQQENDKTVVCIFVNPTQFNVTADFERYPRTLLDDSALLEKQGIDFLICPSAEEVYPDDYAIQVSEQTELSKNLEGAYRPGHFVGMLTVVLKILLLVQPAQAYYGEKDYQQLLLIQKMASALFLRTKIIGCPTIRDHDGLAMSSRNRLLTVDERQLAAHFPTLLHQLQLPVESITSQLTQLGFRVDYITEQWQRRLGAIWVNQVRLIDNIAL